MGRTYKKQKGGQLFGQRAPRPSRGLRKGSAASAAAAASPAAKVEGVQNSSLTPGVGVLIDPDKIIAGADDSYYIVVKGKRIYGSNPDEVLGTIAAGVADDVLKSAPLDRSGTAGIGSLINVDKATGKKADKYYLVIRGKRYYGATPEAAIATAKRGNHGKRSWSQYAKNTAKATGSALGSAARVTGSALGSAARATGSALGSAARVTGSAASRAASGVQSTWSKGAQGRQRTWNATRRGFVSAAKATGRGLKVAGQGALFAGKVGVGALGTAGSAVGSSAVSGARAVRSATAKGVSGITKKVTRGAQAYKNLGTVGPAAATKKLVDEVGRKANEFISQRDAKRAIRLRQAINNLKAGGDNRYHKSNNYNTNPNGAIYKTMTDEQIATETGVSIRTIREAQNKLGATGAPQQQGTLTASGPPPPGMNEQLND
jgi:hypothetical protein